MGCERTVGWDFSGGFPLKLGAGLPNLTSTPLQAPLKTLTPNGLEGRITTTSPSQGLVWFGFRQDLQGRVLFHPIRPNCSPPQDPIPLLPLVRPLHSFITPSLALKDSFFYFYNLPLSLVILLKAL